jgi:hypothetical protein
MSRNNVTYTVSGPRISEFAKENDGFCEVWLGGRDLNPDTVVQRAVNGLRSVPVCSVLFQFSTSALRCGPFRSAVFPHKMSHCVSGHTMCKSIVDDSSHPAYDLIRAIRDEERSSAPEPVRRSGPKIGPNDPCPCGSGRKHKKCCRR